MNTEPPNLFDLASKRIKWLSDRQKVISENIANAETSGFKAREVESFEDYMSTAAELEIAPEAESMESASTWGEDLTGNSVVLEEQILAASSTASQYKVAANLYRKAHEMMRAVAGR